MKYRIKIVTYADGGKEYFAYKKIWFIWHKLSLLGRTAFDHSYPWYYTCNTREEAIQAIDLNFERTRSSIQSIDFEYINKQ